MRRQPAIALAALLASAALGACGSSSGTDSGRTTITKPTGSQKADARAGAALQNWPFFGRVPARTHYMPTKLRPLDPPLKEAWSINTHGLIEFPPAVAGGVAYVINKYGNGKAVRLSDRKVLWELKVDPKGKGSPRDVTAPLYYDGKVYGAFIGGDLAAGRASDGKEVWVRDLGAHLESSPLAVDGRIYIGTNEGALLALDAKTGRSDWKFPTPGAIKASPSYRAGHVFVGDYESSMFAVDATTGDPVWRTNTSKVAPYGQGGFFSSPSISFGRVYAARDDGVVYAFDEKTGKVDWSFQAGGAIYGSPAVAAVPGTRPTVYIGAENGVLYALDAATGKVRWHRSVGGPIPGTATVIGHTVYSSSFKTQRTIGIDVRSRRQTFSIHQAGYTPMVSDGRRLYLVGYYTLIGLDPTTR